MAQPSWFALYQRRAGNGWVVAQCTLLPPVPTTFVTSQVRSEWRLSRPCFGCFQTSVSNKLDHKSTEKTKKTAVNRFVYSWFLSIGSTIDVPSLGAPFQCSIWFGPPFVFRTNVPHIVFVWVPDQCSTLRLVKSIKTGSNNVSLL